MAKRESIPEDNNVVTTSYRGEAIRYLVDRNEWFWSGSNVGFYSLANVQKSIDRAHGIAKLEKKFKQFQAIELTGGYRDLPKEVTVTSYVSEGDMFWVKSEKDGRKKVAAEHIFAMTPENLELAAQYKKANEAEKAASNEQHRLRQLLTLVDTTPFKLEESQ